MSETYLDHYADAMSDENKATRVVRFNQGDVLFESVNTKDGNVRRGWLKYSEGLEDIRWFAVTATSAA